MWNWLGENTLAFHLPCNIMVMDDECCHFTKVLDLDCFSSKFDFDLDWNLIHILDKELSLDLNRCRKYKIIQIWSFCNWNHKKWILFLFQNHMRHHPSIQLHYTPSHIFCNLGFNAHNHKLKVPAYLPADLHQHQYLELNRKNNMAVPCGIFLMYHHFSGGHSHLRRSKLWHCLSIYSLSS